MYSYNNNKTNDSSQLFKESVNIGENDSSDSKQSETFINENSQISYSNNSSNNDGEINMSSEEEDDDDDEDDDDQSNEGYPKKKFKASKEDSKQSDKEDEWMSGSGSDSDIPLEDIDDMLEEGLRESVNKINEGLSENLVPVHEERKKIVLKSNILNIY